MKKLKMRGKPKNWDDLPKKEQQKWKDEQRAYQKEWAKRAKITKAEDGQEWLTPQQVANSLGVSKDVILNSIKLGQLKASCYNKRVIRIHKSNISQYAVEVCSEVVSDATAILAAMMAIPEQILRKYPELMEAKREQIKILRELKPIKRTKQNAPEPQ